MADERRAARGSTLFARTLRAFFAALVVLLALVAGAVVVGVQVSASGWTASRNRETSAFLQSLVLASYRSAGRLDAQAIARTTLPYLDESTFLFVFDLDSRIVFAMRRGERLDVAGGGDGGLARNFLQRHAADAVPVELRDDGQADRQRGGRGALVRRRGRGTELPPNVRRDRRRGSRGVVPAGRGRGLPVLVAALAAGLGAVGGARAPRGRRARGELRGGRGSGAGPHREERGCAAAEARGRGAPARPVGRGRGARPAHAARGPAIAARGDDRRGAARHPRSPAAGFARALAGRGARRRSRRAFPHRESRV